MKYKKDILSRPKNEWHSTKKHTKDLKVESRKDLKNIKENFEGQVATYFDKDIKKRDKKKAEKD